MAQIDANGINLEYEWYGDRSNRPVIGVTGFSKQLVCWPKTFLDGIDHAGYSFIAFDSRESGLSARFEDAGSLDISGILDGTASYDMPYTLDDMARDTIGLMDALEIEKAHVIGYSTGGYKSLVAALEAPDRLQSVVSLFSSSFDPRLPLGNDDVIQAAINICFPMADRDDCVERVSNYTSYYNGRKYGHTAEELRKKIGRSYDRGWYSDGIARHALAIATREPRADEFVNIKHPTLCIGGTDDCFFSTAHAKDLLSRLPNATLEIIEGAGHALTDALSEVIMPSITKHLDTATLQSD